MNRSKDSSACAALNATWCISSPSPLRNCPMLTSALAPNCSTLEMASVKTDENPWPGAAAGTGAAGGRMMLMGAIGSGMGLPHDVDGAVNHVLHRRDSRDI